MSGGVCLSLSAYISTTTDVRTPLDGHVTGVRAQERYGLHSLQQRQRQPGDVQCSFLGLNGRQGLGQGPRRRTVLSAVAREARKARDEDGHLRLLVHSSVIFREQRDGGRGGGCLVGGELRVAMPQNDPLCCSACTSGNWEEGGGRAAAVRYRRVRAN